MKIIEYLKENRPQLNNGLPVELLDVIDGRSVSAGSLRLLMDELEKVGLEHVRNARFVFDDMDNGQDRIVLWYVKDLKEYDDFDLRQLGARLKRLEGFEQLHEQGHRESLDKRLSAAVVRSSEVSAGLVGRDDFIRE